MWKFNKQRNLCGKNIEKIFLIENNLNIIKNEDYLQVNNLIDSMMYKSCMRTRDKSEIITNINNEVK